MKDKNITLAMGGGYSNHKLIKDLFLKHFTSPRLHRLEDASYLDYEGPMAVTTDSYTVDPLFFAGGNIGSLSIYGSCNDLAMMASEPGYITVAFIVEEGFAIDQLEKIVASMAAAAAEIQVEIVTGDTKVVEKGAADKIFINTTAIGPVQKKLNPAEVSEGAMILLSGTVGDHGALVFSQRENMKLSSALQSDLKHLWPPVKALLEKNIAIQAMRDLTRGGLAAIANELVGASGMTFELAEDAIPVRQATRGICELLGLDPWQLANEGCFLCIVDKEDADAALKVLRGFDEHAEIVGRVTHSYPGRVVLQTGSGAHRFLEPSTGEVLPRIC